MTIFKDLIGKPYQEYAYGPDAYDCQGLVAEVSRRFNIPFPIDSNLSSDSDRLKIYERFIKLHECYQLIKYPRPGDVVAIQFPYPDIVTHIGIIVDSYRFMHSRVRAGVCIERLDSFAWSKRIAGIYRYECPRNSDQQSV